MTIGDFRDAPDPGALFLRLWDLATSWSYTQRDDAVRREDMSQALKDDLLMNDDGGQAVTALIDALEETETGAADRLMGVVLDAMQAIDEVFDHIHPRHPVLAPAKAPRRRLPAWLINAQEGRTLGRPFAQDDRRHLVPRGPFTAGPRLAATLNGETLEDRFVALTAAPRFLLAHGREIEILSQVVGHDLFSGVPPGREAGQETIGVVAVAERAGDLEAVRTERNGSPHLDIRVRASLAAGERFFDGVQKLGSLDIAMAPELTLSEVQAAIYADRLSRMTADAPRLSVAGSGGSDRIDDRGRRENLSIMYNGVGAELWRHRKVWPYKMTPEQVAFMRWEPISQGQTLAEDMIDGDHFTIADIDSLGRVLTLICQDFEIQPAVAEAIRLYQPDWVLVPILDTGVSFNRWPHRTAHRLSGQSNARFVVASSLALADQAGIDDYTSTPMAILVGPHDPTAGGPAGDTPRLIGTVRCNGKGVMCGKLTWGRGEHWTQAALGATDN